MRAVGLVIAFGACNWAYDLDRTRPENIDGPPQQFFDAPADAPFGCPANGGQPRFKKALHQIPVGRCQSYSPSYDANRALALCDGLLGLVQGPLDGPMAPMTPSNLSVSEPRIFPEGDRAFVKNKTDAMLEIYTRDGDVWTRTSAVTPFPSQWHISNPSRGPDRRAIVIEYSESQLAYLITELAEQGTAWPVRDSYLMPTGGFGINPTLSGDGLRLVFEGPGNIMFYATRADLSQRFGGVVALSTVPSQVTHAYLRDDCGRIYFSAIDTVLYLEQE